MCDELGMDSCKLCEKLPPKQNGICEKCMSELGIIEMPPPRRRAAPCVKCSGVKFVRVIPREYTVLPVGDANFSEIAPMTLTQKPKLSSKFFGKGKSVGAPRVLEGDGLLETYTCLQCGYVEWYVENPAEIPIGPEFMSDIVDYLSDAPYR